MNAAGNKEEIVQKGNIYVVLLNGERIVIDYGVVSTVLALRQQIYAKNRIEIAKQKLVYNGVELMVSRIRNTSCLIAIWPYLPAFIGLYQRKPSHETSRLWCQSQQPHTADRHSL